MYLLIKKQIDIINQNNKKNSNQSVDFEQKILINYGYKKDVDKFTKKTPNERVYNINRNQYRNFHNPKIA